MQTGHLIEAEIFCSHHNVEVSFIRSLSEVGLIEVTTLEERNFIDESQLEQLEKMVRMHHDLSINLEGIEAITYLLQRFEEMQNEMSTLRNKLRFYNQ